MTSQLEETQRGNWSNWERGFSIPDVKYLCNLCSIYGVTLDWFYMGREVGMLRDVIDELRRAEVELRNGKKYRKSPNNNRA